MLKSMKKFFSRNRNEKTKVNKVNPSEERSGTIKRLPESNLSPVTEPTDDNNYRSDDISYRGYIYDNYQGPYSQLFKTHQQWIQIVEIFLNMDLDNDGRIDDNEMWTAVNKVGLILKKTGERTLNYQMSDFFRILEKDREHFKVNGFSLSYFLDLCKKTGLKAESWPPKFTDYEFHVADEKTFNAYLQSFNDIDKDGDHNLSKIELREFFKTEHDVAIQDLELDDLLLEFDHNHDDQIQFGEFIYLMEKRKGVRA